jgi:hypothetical protein
MNFLLKNRPFFGPFLKMKKNFKNTSAGWVSSSYNPADNRQVNNSKTVKKTKTNNYMNKQKYFGRLCLELLQSSGTLVAATSSLGMHSLLY